MEKNNPIILILFFLVLLVSCEKQIDEEKIPINSLYFSCKIDGELVVLKSPVITSNSFGISIMELNPLSKNLKDSVVLGYYKGFSNDSISVTIGFNRSLLVDSAYTLYNTKGLNYKENIFATGAYIFQYAYPTSITKTITAQEEGIYLQIGMKKMKAKGNYASYMAKTTDYSKVTYDVFKCNSSCQITKSMNLDYYNNAWYIESTFNCKLYDTGYESTNSVILTEGRFSTVY